MAERQAVYQETIITYPAVCGHSFVRRAGEKRESGKSKAKAKAGIRGRAINLLLSILKTPLPCYESCTIYHMSGTRSLVFEMPDVVQIAFFREPFNEALDLG
jgi:hypothetical protein